MTSGNIIYILERYMNLPHILIFYRKNKEQNYTATEMSRYTNKSYVLEALYFTLILIRRNEANPN